jgi:ferredoxin/flavodoxin
MTGRFRREGFFSRDKGNIMKGILFYYSGSGNTKLACQTIAGNLKEAEWTLFDMVKDKNPDPGAFDPGIFDLAGFAAFADFLGPSRLFLDFVDALPAQDRMPAFVFNTYGSMSGGTLLKMAKRLSQKGFDVLAGHSLHTPESYPPMVAAGKAFTHSPDEGELEAFRRFLEDLNGLVGSLKSGGKVEAKPLPAGFLDRLLPVPFRTVSKRMMGKKFVDEEKCNSCGVCAKGCPCHAIAMREKPVFDEKRCYGCWFCYNHCPRLAIYTKKLRGAGHYPRPNAELTAKLRA